MQDAREHRERPDFHRYVEHQHRQAPEGIRLQAGVQRTAADQHGQHHQLVAEYRARRLQETLRTFRETQHQRDEQQRRTGIDQQDDQRIADEGHGQHAEQQRAHDDADEHAIHQQRHRNRQVFRPLAEADDIGEQPQVVEESAHRSFAQRSDSLRKLGFYMSTPPLSDQPAVTALAERLAAAPWIALDTEFLRERTYRPQLCLLQLAAPGEALCVDPLAGLSLEPLKPVLAGGTAPKILHAARQDLEVLWPEFGALAPLFDTQIAAALTGLPAQIGYSDLVRRLIGVELPKGQTRTDWSKRPLSEAQLSYAIDDVVHLAPLREQLLEQLDKLGRLAWLEEELGGLARAERLFVDPEKAHARLRWHSELDPDRARLLQRLAAWRERRAMEKDRPRSWILEDAALRALVLQVPRNTAQLAQIADLQPGFVERSGPVILREIVAAGMPEQLPALAPRSRPDPEIQARIKRLGAIVQKRATELGLASEVLATRRDLEGIVHGDAAADVLVGWRNDAVGKELLAAG